MPTIDEKVRQLKESAERAPSKEYVVSQLGNGQLYVARGADDRSASGRQRVITVSDVEFIKLATPKLLLEIITEYELMRSTLTDLVDANEDRAYDRKMQDD